MAGLYFVVILLDVVLRVPAEGLETAGVCSLVTENARRKGTPAVVCGGTLDGAV